MDAVASSFRKSCFGPSQAQAVRLTCVFWISRVGRGTPGPIPGLITPLRRVSGRLAGGRRLEQTAEGPSTIPSRAVRPEGEASVNEAMYWNQLQARVCRELDGLEEYHRRGLWCHGFVAKEYAVDSSPAQIVGQVWIGVGPREHESWGFTLVLKQKAADRASVPWQELLPADDVTGWMTVDLGGRRMAVDPGSAVPIA